MLLDPYELSHNLDRLEEIEKTSLRLVTQAIYGYRAMAEEIFQEESDLVADIGEDITREAMDRMGMSKIDQRLFGKVDYKRACYLFPVFCQQDAALTIVHDDRHRGQDQQIVSDFGAQVVEVRGHRHRWIRFRHIQCYE
jgi:hypothetical protein